MKIGTPNFRKGSYTPTTIDGKKALQFEVTAKHSGHNIIYWITVVEGKRHYYQVATWTRRSKASSNRDALMRITRSFKCQ